MTWSIGRQCFSMLFGEKSVDDTWPSLVRVPLDGVDSKELLGDLLDPLISSNCLSCNVSPIISNRPNSKYQWLQNFTPNIFIAQLKITEISLVYFPHKNAQENNRLQMSLTLSQLYFWRLWKVTNIILKRSENSGSKLKENASC